MSLAQKFTSFTTYKYLSKARKRLLGEPNTFGPEQIGSERKPLEIAFHDLPWNRGRNGRTVERVAPKDLGYDFPEVPGIFIGDCGSVDIHYGYDFGSLGGAHTHMCPKDVFNRCICISSKEYIFDEVMWHEYAHVLTKYTGMVSIRCREDSLHDVTFANAELVKSWRNGHNNEWRKLIQEFGFPDREHIPIGEIPTK